MAITTTMPRRHRTLTPLLSTLLLTTHTVHASFSLNIPPGGKECFVIAAPTDRSSTLSGNYDCLNDDMDPSVVSAWIEDTAKPHKTLYKSTDEQSEGLFSLQLQPHQRVQLCFDVMTMDDVDATTIAKVGFNVRLEPELRSLPENVIGPDAQRGLTHIKAAASIQADWYNMLDHFDFLRHREAVHDLLQDSIMSRVMAWTVAEACLVTFTAVAQVAYWKKFFEQRRYL